MTISNDSYGSVAAVVALTRLYLMGETTFNTTTRPTGTEVEAFIDRASAVLNLALADRGFDVPVTQTTAALACGDWVVSKAAAMVEYAQPSAAYGVDDNPRPVTLGKLHKEASEFVAAHELGFKRLGATVLHPTSEGLVFAGETAPADRADPVDTSLEQPLFTRRLFDNE